MNHTSIHSPYVQTMKGKLSPPKMLKNKYDLIAMFEIEIHGTF